MASKPDFWRSSEYNENFDICIKRSASSTSLWATVLENRSLAKACKTRTRTQLLSKIFKMLKENGSVNKKKVGDIWDLFIRLSYNGYSDDAKQCPDGCVRMWSIWSGFFLTDAGICSGDVILQFLWHGRNDFPCSRDVWSANKERNDLWSSLGTF